MRRREITVSTPRGVGRTWAAHQLALAHLEKLGGISPWDESIVRLSPFSSAIPGVRCVKPNDEMTGSGRIAVLIVEDFDLSPGFVPESLRAEAVKRWSSLVPPGGLVIFTEVAE